MNLSGYLRRTFIPSQSKAALGETLALSLIGYALVIWHSTSLPENSQSGFPWWLLVPLLVGLRYGVVCALVPVVLQAVILPRLPLAAPFYQALPDDWLSGTIVLSVVCGEFREIWGRRLSQHRAIQNYCQQQLQTFIRDYNLLQYSHAELEKTASLSESSLQNKIESIKHRLVVQLSDQPMAAIAEQIMAVLSQYGGVTEGCLLYVNDSGQCTDTILACYGQRGPFFANDPIIQQGLKKRQPVMVDLVAFSKSDLLLMDLQHSRALMAIPVVASDGQIPAMLAIYRTDPDNLSVSYLSFISLIACYLADALLPVAGDGPRGAVMPEFPLLVAEDPAHNGFLAQLQQCCWFARVHTLESLLLVFQAENDQDIAALGQALTHFAEPMSVQLPLVNGEHLLYWLLPIKRTDFAEQVMAQLPEFLYQNSAKPTQPLEMQPYVFLPGQARPEKLNKRYCIAEPAFPTTMELTSTAEIGNVS